MYIAYVRLTKKNSRCHTSSIISTVSCHDILLNTPTTSGWPLLHTAGPHTHMALEPHHARPILPYPPLCGCSGSGKFGPRLPSRFPCSSHGRSSSSVSIPFRQTPSLTLHGANTGEFVQPYSESGGSFDRPCGYGLLSRTGCAPGEVLSIGF